MASPRRTIGRYEILRELGRGMMGVVYEARDTALNRTIALKTINLSCVTLPADRDEFERRFAAEAHIAGRLSHPGIVVVHDVGRDPADGLLFIAFERLPGDDLAALMERGKHLPWRESLEIVRQVAEALQHAHDEGVIHRDIKPANIMLLPSGQPKVMDFGIAKLRSGHLTAAGQLFGTPLFMSPEQALSRRVDARTDIFSLGSVAYTLLTGRQAFEAESVIRILGRVVHQDPVPPSTLDPALPPDADYLIARALAKSPDDRYRQARHLAEDIEDVLAARPPRHRAGWVPPPPARAPEGEPTLVAEVGPAAYLPTITVGPARASGEAAPPLPPVLRAGFRGLAHPLAPRTQALLLALTLALAGLVWSRSSPSPLPPVPSTPTTLPAPSVLPATLEPSPLPSPVPAPARVVVDFEYPLESGTLRLWLDGEELLVETVKGAITRNLVLFQLAGGVLTEVLDVSAGRHQVRVEVRWSDQRRTQEIAGRFQPGETYRLEIRLGRLRKDLSLRWTR
jgi:serine/threonine-protein kinase